ncbi:MAG: ankyrin repeat domain-containing protein [Leptospiraceae bacterium]|nr:ankyrin repeat domain-containing protein [Leptospiraceae bacterium]MCB1201845.1 ankyrin repeat domain-containing protein [Leptospiraceae bacterium]
MKKYTFILMTVIFTGFLFHCGTGDKINVTEENISAPGSGTGTAIKGVQEDLNCDKRDNDGATQYIRAARFGKRDQMAKWLALGCDVNAVDNYGWTALTWASSKGFVDASKDIITAGGKIDVPDRNSATPLMYAAGNGHKDIVQLLLAKGANKSLRSKAGYRAADYATNDDIKALVQ